MKKNLSEYEAGDYIQARTKYGTLRGKVYFKLTISGLLYYYINVKNKFTVDGNRSEKVAYCPRNGGIVMVECKRK